LLHLAFVARPLPLVALAFGGQRPKGAYFGIFFLSWRAQIRRIFNARKPQRKTLSFWVFMPISAIDQIRLSGVGSRSEGQTAQSGGFNLVSR
jgi:hypothetical protein